MHIGLVTDTYPLGRPSAGIGTYTEIVAHEMARQGHDVDVICLPPRGWRRGDPEQEAETRDGNVRIVMARPGFPRSALSCLDKRFLLISYRRYRLLQTALRLRQVVRALGSPTPYDYLECPEYGGYGRFLRSDSALHSWGIRLHAGSRMLANNGGPSPVDIGARDRLEMVACRRAPVICSPSHALADTMSGLWKIKRSRIRCTPNPYERAPVAAAEASARRPDTVVFWGRLEPLKGIDVLAQAMAPILCAGPSTQFTMIGHDSTCPSGERGSEIVEQIRRQTGVPAHVVTLLPPMERLALLRHAVAHTVAVFPSRYENYPMAVIEAMSLGLPVVSSRVGGIPEIVDDHVSGILTTPGNSADLAAAVVELLHDEPLRTRIGRNASEWTEQLAPHRVVPRLMADWGLA